MKTHSLPFADRRLTEASALVRSMFEFTEHDQERFSADGRYIHTAVYRGKLLLRERIITSVQLTGLANVADTIGTTPQQEQFLTLYNEQTRAALIITSLRDRIRIEEKYTDEKFSRHRHTLPTIYLTNALCTAHWK